MVACVLAGSTAMLPSAGAAEKRGKSAPAMMPTYSTAFSAAVDEIVNTTMLNLKIPSVTVAVAHNGVLLHTGAYGLAQVKTNETPTTQTTYLLDSMTKQFTAAAIMLLVQDGKLDLDKPVKTYVPYAPKVWDTTTIRHLLTHTAGLPHDPQWGYPSVKSQDGNPDRLLKHFIFNQTILSAPGQKYAYSNTGYAALGAIVAKVSGVRYSQFMRQRIFLPLQMNNTGICYSGGDVKHGARGYNYVSDKKQWSVNTDSYQPLAAGAIESNVLDLAKWDAALNGSTILTEASKQEMWKSFKLTSGQMSDYGFGWVPDTVNGQPMVFHNGGGWGFNNGFYRFLGSGLTVIVLTNLNLEDTGVTHADQLARSIAAAYSPDLDMGSNDTSGGAIRDRSANNDGKTAGAGAGTGGKKNDDPKTAKSGGKKSASKPPKVKKTADASAMGAA